MIPSIYKYEHLENPYIELTLNTSILSTVSSHFGYSNFHLSKYLKLIHIFINTFALHKTIFSKGILMNRKENAHPLNWKTALTLSFLITAIFSGLAVFTMIEGARIAQFETNGILVNMGHRFVGNMFLFFLLYMFAFKVIQAPLRRWVKCVVTILGTFLFACILNVFFSLVIVSIKQVEFTELFVLFRLLHDFFVAVIVLLSTSQLYVMSLRQKTLIENERLIAENIRNRYEALKNQVDPHFLFNSLNALNGLIGYDDGRAHKYVEKLSSVFRYTIQNKEIITLRDELDFTDSYAYLIKIRYGENFQIQYDIPEKYYSYHIMPISIQLQIENAIKHNVISNKYPLNIKISVTKADTLVIENNIQAKTLPVASTGIGLANLTERYRLLFRKEVIISNANNMFRVEIPLISPKEIEKNQSQ